MDKMQRKILKRSIVILPLVIMACWLVWGLSGGGQLVAGELSEVTEEVEEAAVNDMAYIPGTGYFESSTPVSPEDSSIFVGGVQMNEGDQRNWIRSLVESEMNTVEVTVYAHQGRWNDNNLWYYPHRQNTIEEIRLAKLAGLKVVMILRMQMDHSFPKNKFLWHGMIFPETEYLLHRWFDEYGDFVKSWAEVAEKEGVDVFMIGSEMNAMFATRLVEKIPNLEEYYLNAAKQKKYHSQMLRHKDSITEDLLFVYGEDNYTDLEAYLKDQSEANRKWAELVTFSDSTDQVHAINVRRTILNYYWERLIDEVRGIYQGKLSIAANFDNYHQVRFWHKLDYIGINAYFPLRSLENANPTVADFTESWDSILTEINSFRELAKVPDMPVFFSELGYANHSGATLRPWEGQGFALVERSFERDSLIIWKDQQVDFSERNKAVAALYHAVERSDFPLEGILYWKFTSKEEQLQYDPFALHIGRNSKDTLPGLLVKFKDSSVQRGH